MLYVHKGDARAHTLKHIIHERHKILARLILPLHKNSVCLRKPQAGETSGLLAELL
jgi:hypothetical protein